MQTESAKDDPRQIIRDVAKIVGGKLRTKFKIGWMPMPCYAISCNDPMAVVEEAAVNGLRGARWMESGNHYVIYWPSVT